MIESHNKKVGDLVRRAHPNDGTRFAGIAEGEVLRIEEIKDHSPIEGNIIEKDAVCILSDGSWAFGWNLLFSIEKKRCTNPEAI